MIIALSSIYLVLNVVSWMLSVTQVLKFILMFSLVPLCGLAVIRHAVSGSNNNCQFSSKNKATVGLAGGGRISQECLLTAGDGAGYHRRGKHFPHERTILQTHGQKSYSSSRTGCKLLQSSEDSRSPNKLNPNTHYHLFSS